MFGPSSGKMDRAAECRSRKRKPAQGGNSAGSPAYGPELRRTILFYAEKRKAGSEYGQAFSHRIVKPGGEIMSMDEKQTILIVDDSLFDL